MSTTDDLIAIGCGAAVGKVFFWGLILTVGFVLMHPWVLLIGLGIWWLVKKYGTEPAKPPSTGGFGQSPRPEHSPERGILLREGAPGSR